MSTHIIAGGPSLVSFSIKKNETEKSKSDNYALPESLKQSSDNHIQSLAWNQNGKMFAATDDSGRVLLYKWDPEDNDVALTLNHPKMPDIPNQADFSFTSCTFVENCTEIACGSMSGHICSINVYNNASNVILNCRRSPVENVCVTEYENARVFLSSTAANDLLAHVVRRNQPKSGSSIEYHPTKILEDGGISGASKIIGLTSLRSGISADSPWLNCVVSAHKNCTMKLWDVNTLQKYSSLRPTASMTGMTATSVAIVNGDANNSSESTSSSPGMSAIAMGTRCGHICLRSIDGGPSALSKVKSGVPVSSLAVSANGSILYSLLADGRLEWRDVRIMEKPMGIVEVFSEDDLINSSWTGSLKLSVYRDCNTWPNRINKESFHLYTTRQDQDNTTPHHQLNTSSSKRDVIDYRTGISQDAQHEFVEPTPPPVFSSKRSANINVSPSRPSNHQTQNQDEFTLSADKSLIVDTGVTQTMPVKQSEYEFAASQLPSKQVFSSQQDSQLRPRGINSNIETIENKTNFIGTDKQFMQQFQELCQEVKAIKEQQREILMVCTDTRRDCQRLKAFVSNTVEESGEKLEAIVDGWSKKVDTSLNRITQRLERLEVSSNQQKVVDGIAEIKFGRFSIDP